MLRHLYYIVTSLTADCCCAMAFEGHDGYLKNEADTHRIPSSIFSMSKTFIMLCGSNTILSSSAVVDCYVDRRIESLNLNAVSMILK